MPAERGDADLRAISVRAGGQTFRLHAVEREDAARRRSLASEALRWSYVLRARQRWVDSAEARTRHEADAGETLNGFGLDAQALQAIAQAQQVIVHIDYQQEATGWAARIFPWEYVIAAATRTLRSGSDHPFVVMRELFPGGKPARPGPLAPVFMFVQSAPGRLVEAWQFDEELERLKRALGDKPHVVVLKNPTLRLLADEVQRLRPALIHLAGFDNVQGLRELRGVSGPQTLVDVFPDTTGREGEEALVHGSEPQMLATLLKEESALQDGYFLTSDAGRPCVVTAHTLAAALGGQHAPAALMSVSLGNSAPRTAALLVAQGAAISAVGFYGEIDDALAEYFFDRLYGQLMYLDGAIAPAFARSWDRARQEPNARRATGITLWSASRLDAPAREKPQIQPAPRRGGGPTLDVEAADELNYSVLHNTGRGLFRKLVVERNGADAGSRIAVEVALQLGAEVATWSHSIVVAADDDRWNITNEVHVPLTASLVRSVREMVNSSVTVQLQLDGQVLRRSSHRIKLRPVDQWRDTDDDARWLPSFVLPRDAAVMRAVQQAQRYVRVLRDEPTAGFEGYQAVTSDDSPDEQELMEVDLQVQALWATLMHDWQLGYINPPPSYSSLLDSQRLRTPSTVQRNAAGTCIDLALLLAACLELVDIYPVVFLLDGHALPGYWRHRSFQEKFSQAVFPETDTPALRGGSSADIQRCAWQTTGRDAHREIAARIRARELVPIETVRLTENCGFVAAIEAGIEALAPARDFHSLLDIVQARSKGVTPLPVVEDAP
jgi:hypothetical protein